MNYRQPLADGTQICLEHITYGHPHRIHSWFYKPDVKSEDALVFWVKQYRVSPKRPIRLALDGVIVDAEGQMYSLVSHGGGGHTGPSHPETSYVWELAPLLPLGKPLSLRVSLIDHQNKNPVPFAEYELPNTTEWLQMLKDKTQNYVLSPQYLHDNLVFAIGEGNDTTARELIHHGARVSDIRIMGYNDLCYAITKGDTEVAMYLIRQGADIEIASVTGQTSLMFAVIYENEALVAALIERGANTHAVDMYGHDALYYANRIKKAKRIKTMLARG